MFINLLFLYLKSFEKNRKDNLYFRKIFFQFKKWNHQNLLIFPTFPKKHCKKKFFSKGYAGAPYIFQNFRHFRRSFFSPQKPRQNFLINMFPEQKKTTSQEISQMMKKLRSFFFFNFHKIVKKYFSQKFSDFSIFFISYKTDKI